MQLRPEKGDQCPHCGNIDTHIGYVCPKIKSVGFSDGGQFITKIEYHPPVTYQSIPALPPVYDYHSPRPYGGAGGGGGFPTMSGGSCWSGTPAPVYSPVVSGECVGSFTNQHPCNEVI